MLTLGETGWSLKAFKIFSILNLIPIQVDVKNGKIQRQSNRIKLLIWKILFGVGIFHWIYMFVRLIQTAVMDREKYFRWDHFVLHFGFTCLYATFYVTAVVLFLKSPEENVIIFNQLFTEREDPVQKMIDEMQKKVDSGNKNEEKGNKTRGKSGAKIPSPQNREPRGEGQTGNGIERVIEKESKSGVGPRPRPLLTWPPPYSLDELIAKLHPISMVLTELFTLLLFVMDPTRPQILFSCLPPEGQNLWSFLILLAVEAKIMAVVFFCSTFAVVTQVLFFGKCHVEFQRVELQLRNLQEKFQNSSLEIGNSNEVADFRRQMWTLRQILEEMRELVLFIELFNRCYPFVIFPMKLVCLMASVLGYFFVIRYSKDFPFLSLFIWYCATVGCLIYTTAYDKAFSIPGKMEDLKQKFLLTAQKIQQTSGNASMRNKHFLAQMKREIKGIHGAGIKVGSFHQMERESTPNFINFVVNQVVSLLVTFPR